MGIKPSSARVRCVGISIKDFNALVIRQVSATDSWYCFPGGQLEHNVCELPRHLPAPVARAVARDALNRLDRFMVMDATVAGAGYGAKFRAAILGLEGLHLPGVVVGQTVL